MEGSIASPHIKDHYKVVGVVPGVVRARDGKFVDLTTISLERAHELYAQKFPFLQKVEASADLPIVEEISASINDVESEVDVKAEEVLEKSTERTNRPYSKHHYGKK